MPRWVCNFLLTLAATAVAQDCTQSVPVRVVDKETAAPIEPLTADMLTARMGETHLAISSPAHIRAGRIVVLIDESGSMSEIEPSSYSTHKTQALRTVKQTLSDLIIALPPGVSLEYGLFNKKWAFSDGFISDPEELRKNIAETIAGFGKRGYGNTALRDALHDALLRFGTSQPGDSILLLTDGGENASKLTVRQVEHDFRVAHVRLLTMMVNESGVVPDEEQMARDWIEDLVKKTGGSYLAIDATNQSWGDKKNNVRNIAMIRGFWNDRVLGTDVIQVQVPGSITKETKWKLSVNREADPRLKRATVVYPDRLAPCPVAASTAP
jgi:hypothetical protein